MVYKYGWKINKYPGVSAEEAGKHIEKIQYEQGVVTSANLLESARPEDSAIHPCYEWDDAVAAEKYRLSQSNDLLQNLVQVIVAEDGSEEKVSRAFVNVAEIDQFTPGSYVKVETALSDEGMRRIVLQKALKEVLTFKAKYENLSELAEVFKAISDLEKKIG